MRIPLKTEISPKIWKPTLFLLWASVLLNIFLSLNYPQILPNETRGFPQPVVFESMILNLPINWLMPLIQHVWILSAKLPYGMEFLPQAVFYCLIMMFLFGAATIINAPIGRIAAPIFFLLFLCFPVNGIDIECATYKEDMLYAFTCSMVAYALLIRGKIARRTLRTEFLLATSIGISFMTKSPLVFLPPILAAYDIISGKLKRRETSWLMISILCVFPYAMLFPWIYMNHRVYDVFTLFEHNRGADNILAGALGVIYAIEGGVRNAAGIGEGTNTILWAIKTVLTNPLEYASSVLQRVYIEFSWYPTLATLFITTLLRFRDNEQFRLLGLFVIYFIGIHSMLAIDARYFYPLYPTLILGAAVIFDDAKPAPIIPLSTKLIFSFLLSLLVIAYLHTSWNIFTYAKTAKPAAEAVSIAQKTGKPVKDMTLAYASQSELADGDIDAAYKHAREAMLIRKSYETIKIYTYALIAKGHDARAVFQQRQLDCKQHMVDCLMIDSLNYFAKKEPEKGLSKFYLAYQEYHQQAFWFCEPDAEQKPELYERYKNNAETISIEQWIKHFLSALPPNQAKNYRQLILAPQEISKADGQTRIDLFIGNYLIASQQILKTPYARTENNPLILKIAKDTTQAILSGEQPWFGAAAENPFRKTIIRSRQELAMEYMRQCRASAADRQTRLLLAKLLQRLSHEDPRRNELAAKTAAQCIQPEDILQLMDETSSEDDAISLGKTYLRFRKDPVVESRVIEKFMSLEQKQNATAEQDALKQNSTQQRNTEDTITAGNRQSNPPPNIEKPEDASALLNEAEALLIKGKQDNAAKEFSKINPARLQPEQAVRLNIGKSAAEGKYAQAKKIAQEYLAGHEDATVRNMLDNILMGPQAEKICATGQKEPVYSELCGSDRIAALIREERIPEAAKEVTRFAQSPGNEWLYQLILSHPKVTKSLESLLNIFGQKNYPILVSQAKVHLEQYPFDSRVRLLLIQTLIITDNHKDALHQINLLTPYRLSPAQTVAATVSRLIAERKYGQAKQTAARYLASHEDADLQNLATYTLLGRHISKICSTPTAKDYSILCGPDRVQALIQIGNLKDAAQELALLPRSAQTRQLAELLLAKPEIKEHLDELYRLHDSNRQEELLKQTEQHLTDYPIDDNARILLMEAFLMKGRTDEAAAQFAHIDQSRLTTEKAAYVTISKLMAEKRYALAKKSATDYLAGHDDPNVRNLRTSLLLGPTTNKACSNPKNAGYDELCGADRLDALLKENRLKELAAELAQQPQGRKILWVKTLLSKNPENIRQIESLAQFSADSVLPIILPPLQATRHGYPIEVQPQLLLAEALWITNAPKAAAEQLASINTAQLQPEQKSFIHVIRLLAEGRYKQAKGMATLYLDQHKFPLLQDILNQLLLGPATDKTCKDKKAPHHDELCGPDRITALLNANRIKDAAFELSQKDANLLETMRLRQLLLDSNEPKQRFDNLLKLYADKQYPAFIAQARIYAEDFPFDKRILPLWRKVEAESKLSDAHQHQPPPTKFKELSSLYENKQYVELIPSAKAYLAKYPDDRTATLYLATALLLTGNYPDAAQYVAKAERLPLAPHEKKWANDLKLSLEKAQTSQYFRNLSRI